MVSTGAIFDDNAGLSADALSPAARFMRDTMQAVTGNQQIILNSQQASRDMLGVMIQDNLNLKSENTSLRERMLELERELAELHRHFVDTRERTEIRMRVLEDAIAKLMVGQPPASRSGPPPAPRPGTPPMPQQPQGYATQAAPPPYPPQGYAPQAMPPSPTRRQPTRLKAWRPAPYPPQPYADQPPPPASGASGRGCWEGSGLQVAGCRWQVASRSLGAILHLPPATCHSSEYQKIKFNSAAGVKIMPAAVVSGASSPTRS